MAAGVLGLVTLLVAAPGDGLVGTPEQRPSELELLCSSGPAIARTMRLTSGIVGGISCGTGIRRGSPFLAASRSDSGHRG